MSTINYNLSEKILDWYWDHGSKREGAYSLSRGIWLDRMLRVMTEARHIDLAQTVYSKPTMALWGPSQSGKSTLLAKFIDLGADENGNGSALSWDAACPARFSGDNKGGTVAVLNPYNQGADASGCVTRFQLKDEDEVRFKQYPVEIQFATDQEILLSMAVGYLSETEALNKKGEKVIWDAGDLMDLAAAATKGVKDATPNREAYTLLTELLNVVDVLIDIAEDRYRNLQSEWSARRSDLLNNDKLISSTEVVEDFAANLLWDGWKNMTDVYKQLRNKRRELGNKTVYCSIEMAALMLNISSAQYYKDSDYIRNLVDNCKLEDKDEETVIITTDGGGKKLFHGDIDFGLAQGLVSLIVVPLKRSIMEQGQPEVYELLQKVDLVDFPGVANEHKAAELIKDDQIALDYANEHGRRPLLALTQVLKRGKTASIVVSSARHLNIDAFSLLVRMPAGQQYPAQPKQLMNGIRCWFKAMGKECAEKLPRDRQLSINLLLTFSASLLNLVDASGTGSAGLIGVFDKLRGMGDLADPGVVTTYCVNYPMFPDGKIDIETTERKLEVIDNIAKDKHFLKQFAGTEDSLRAMADIEEEQYGGRIYLFRKLNEMMATTHRQSLLEKKSEAIATIWKNCLSEALPPLTDDDSKRAKDINKVIEALITPDNDPDKLLQVAYNVQDFQNIDATKLEILPKRDREIPTYVDGVINRWIEDSKNKPLQNNMGFESEEHRTRILTYLYAIMDKQKKADMVRWLEIIDIKDKEERKECRRLVATYLANEIFPLASTHRKEKDSIALLNSITEKGNGRGKNDPYYISVIKPFCDVLEVLKNSPDMMRRGKQPGDDELVSMLG